MVLCRLFDPDDVIMPGLMTGGFPNASARVIDPDVLTGGCDPSSCWANPGSDGDISGLLDAFPAPRRIIGDSGAAKDILGNNDLSSDCVIKTISEPTKFDTANGL
eukprot:6593236-Heterocapsa_arctica.AAC.1